MPDEVFDKVTALAKSDKRSKSAMVVILIEDGLRLVLKPDCEITEKQIKELQSKIYNQ